MLLRNLSANMVAGILSPVAAIVFTPFYIRKLGVEGFGAVGFFAVLGVVVQVFAQGINTTLERQVASKLKEPEHREATQILYGTLQRVYQVLGGVVFLAILLLSGPLADLWAGRDGLLKIDARISVILGGGLISLNLLTGLYSSLFIGLGQQVFLSTAAVFVTITQTALAVGFVTLNPRPSSFLFAQVIATAAAMLVLGRTAGKTVGWRESKLRPDLRCLRSEARLSLSLIIVEALGVVITYLDRLLVAALLPLQSLGAYNVAQTGARGLGFLRGPLLQAFTPVILSWASVRDEAAIRGKLWKIQMVMVALVGVPATVLILAAQPLLNLWLGDAALATSAAPSLRLLVAASFLLVLSGPPYLAMVSRKYTRPSLIYNVFAVCAMASAGPFLVEQSGMQGAAITWFAYCLGSVLLSHAGAAHLFYTGVQPLFRRDLVVFLTKSMLTIFMVWAAFETGKFLNADFLHGSDFRTVAEICTVGTVGFILAYAVLLGWNDPRKISRTISAG